MHSAHMPDAHTRPRTPDRFSKEPAKSYEYLTAIAAFGCEAPIALIALKGERRDRLKGLHGLAPQAMPRTLSFLAQTVRHPGVFVVENASEDESFADSPWVMGPPFIRFYAGVALRTVDGVTVGALV